MLNSFYFSVLPEVIKGSRVRTRGGIQKVGTRGVKAIVPQVAKSVDSNIRVIVSPVAGRKPNTPGIKTRAMSKKQEKDKKDIVKPSVAEVIQPSSNEEPEKNQQTELPKENDSLPEQSKEKSKEDCINDVTEATPQQQTIPKYPRMSLSTPRRTHIRALDFETPDKNLNLRRSMTSPKVYQHKKAPKALDFIKRGGMFNSPPKEEEKQQQESKKIKGWDSDLRNFMVSRENLDIPTSVGLKRRAGAKRDKSTNAKRKVTRKRVPKKLLPQKNSNEELVDQIEKEVRDVIGEDEMALNTSQNSELGNLIEQKLMEEMEKNDSSLEILDDKKQQNEACKSLNTPEDTTTQKEIIEDQIRKGDAEKNSESQVGNNEDHTNDAEKHDDGTISEEFNTSTPLKLVMSPVNENSRGQLTPTTKLVMSHLGKVNTRYPSVFSPTSQSSLENILIKECSRMETEKSISNLAQDIEKLSSVKSDSCSNNPTLDLKGTESKKDTSNPCNKELTFESVCKNTINLFQTPAKFLSAPVPPGTPVEMTPLTKVLVSETSFAATVLVTPTLPPTPKNSSLVTPQKTDESSVGSINLSGKEIDKPQENIVISSNTNQEKSINSENHPSKPDIDVAKPPTLVIDSSKTTISNDKIEKNKDFDEASKNIDKKTMSNPVPEKQTCSTPKIKLMSPKLNKTNEPLVKKKRGKIAEQNKSSEGNSSKLAQGEPKLHSDNSFDEKGAEHVIDLENSNNSTQSDINKSSERTIEEKIDKKQGPRESKKQMSARKKTCLERNKKALKKSPKQNIAKPSKTLSVDEEMESEIRHILKDAKAKLFGPDNSSDSDSSVDNDLELKQSSVQLKTARERLQKLKNIRMLNSSSSTSDESSDNETIVKHSVSRKDSKDGVPVKKSERLVEDDSVECNSLISKHSEGFNTKKTDGNNYQKLLESSKVITKEIEESCESFPTLHLSEESNQSLKLDSQLTKCQKSRKSPLGGNELAGKKSSPSLLTISSARANEQVNIENAKTTDPRKISSTTPSKIEGQTNISDKSKSDHESHMNERIIRIYSETVKSKISDSEEKLNLAKNQAISEYLDSYVYSFTLDVDKSGNYLNKELRPSPFLQVFHLGETRSLSPHSKKDDRRIETSRSDQRTRPRSRSRNRKRNRSASNSEDEKEKRDYNRSYNNYRDGNTRGRGRDRAYRFRPNFNRRDSFSRNKYRDMRSHYDSRYRDYEHYSPYDKKRSRCSSPESRRNSKKEDRRPLEEKMQSSKYKMYSSVNESFTSSKSGSEGDGKHTDMNSTYSLERSSEGEKERCSTSSQRLVVDDQLSYSRPQSQAHGRTSKLPLAHEREDGELSDSPEV